MLHSFIIDINLFVVNILRMVLKIMETDNGKISYLQMIQNVVDRMSTTSAIVKGFCATLITGIAAISFTEINKWILLIAFLPVFCFTYLDIYYLLLEKKYRVLYDKVRTEEKNIDFDMKLNLPKTDYINGKATLLDCLKSPSIYAFYGPLILISGGVIVVKFLGVI